MRTSSHSQRRQRPKAQGRRPRFRVEYLLLAGILAFCGWKFVERIQEVRGLQAQATALQSENAQTAHQNASLRSAIRYYRTPRYIESAARSTLGYTQSGEVSVETRPRLAPRVTVGPRPAQPPSPPGPAWEQWWRAFFG